MESAAVRFGKFQLLEELGRGELATVHRAMLHGVGGFRRQIAIQRMLPELAAKAEFVRAFVDQAKLLALLDHTNIVKIYDFGRVDDSYFLAMEYVEGSTLAELEPRQLSPEQAAHAVQQVAEGLHHAHQRGLVHGDLNPSNVVRGEDGTVKLIDFGFAPLERAALADDKPSERRWGYLSPEQADGKPATPWSDIFSAGVLLWELLAGRSLFSGDDAEATLEALQKAEVPPLERPDVDQPLERFEAICRQALASSPGDRFHDAGAMSDALLSALEGSRAGLFLLYGGHTMQKQLDRQAAERFVLDAVTPTVPPPEPERAWDMAPTPCVRPPLGTGPGYPAVGPDEAGTDHEAAHGEAAHSAEAHSAEAHSDEAHSGGAVEADDEALYEVRDPERETRVTPLRAAARAHREAATRQREAAVSPRLTAAAITAQLGGRERRLRYIVVGLSAALIVSTAANVALLWPRAQRPLLVVSAASTKPGLANAAPARSNEIRRRMPAPSRPRAIPPAPSRPRATPPAPSRPRATPPAPARAERVGAGQPSSDAARSALLATISGCSVKPTLGRPLRMGLHVRGGAVIKVLVARRVARIDEAAAGCLARGLTGKRLPLSRPRPTYFEWLATGLSPSAVTLVRERASR